MITQVEIYNPMSNFEKPEEADSDGEREEQQLLNSSNKESPEEEFIRQRKIAQECCDLGRKQLGENDYEGATKEFSKAVMTFEFILKHNVQQRALKGDIADLLKTVIVPAYSNLALCYLKTKKYDMVITFANQVLQSDPANVKNLYRRAVARRHSKAYDQAIEDLEKVMKLDGEMEQECKRLIAQCKNLKVEQKRKQKELAKQFISGYAQEKPEPSPLKEQGGKDGKEGLWSRCMRCIRGICPKLFK